ncbi:MAG: NUDIX hydrolase [Acidobacteriota bacterium]|nr:NUDIX hydrolase [Acidobacteriota bacterium]
MKLLVELAGKLWRRLPKSMRRLGVWLKETSFTVTAGAVVTDERGYVLLLRHRFRPGSGWGIPGGFLKPGEQPEEAIRRELREEIGLEVKAVEFAFIRTLQAYNQVEVIFHCRPQGGFSPQNHEVSRAEWFSPDSLPQSLTNDQRALINKAASITSLKPNT